MINFPGKRPNEKVLLKIEKHWIVNVKIFLKLLLLCIIPVTLAILITTSGYITLSGNSIRVFIIVITFYSIYWLLFSFNNWFNEMIDMILVTNERIIDITQNGLFDRNVTQAELQHIQDSRGESRGFFQTIFKYGNINIKTASGETAFIIDQIAHPVETAEHINTVKTDMLKNLNDENQIDEHMNIQGLADKPKQQ